MLQISHVDCILKHNKRELSDGNTKITKRIGRNREIERVADPKISQRLSGVEAFIHKLHPLTLLPSTLECYSNYIYYYALL